MGGDSNRPFPGKAPPQKDSGSQQVSATPWGLASSPSQPSRDPTAFKPSCHHLSKWFLWTLFALEPCSLHSLLLYCLHTIKILFFNISLRFEGLIFSRGATRGTTQTKGHAPVPSFQSLTSVLAGLLSGCLCERLSSLPPSTQLSPQGLLAFLTKHKCQTQT